MFGLTIYIDVYRLFIVTHSINIISLEVIFFSLELLGDVTEYVISIKNTTYMNEIELKFHKMRRYYNYYTLTIKFCPAGYSPPHHKIQEGHVFYLGRYLHIYVFIYIYIYLMEIY